MTCSLRRSHIRCIALILAFSTLTLVSVADGMAQSSNLWQDYPSSRQSSSAPATPTPSQSNSGSTFSNGTNANYSAAGSTSAQVRNSDSAARTRQSSLDVYGQLGNASNSQIRPVGYQRGLGESSQATMLESQSESPNQPPGELFSSGKVLAMVAGEPIFAGDLLLTINEIIQIKASDAPEHVKEKMREQGIRELLPRAIERKMFYHQAVQMLPDPARIADIKQDLYKQLEEKQLPDMLKKYEANNTAELDGRLRMLGSSWRAVKEQAAEQEIAKFGITSKVKIKTEISHDELVAEYNRRREEFRLENRVRWEHLMVSTDKTPDRKAAKRKLALMGNEIINGAKFSAVAEKGSDGFFANRGGMNDWTKRGSLTNVELENKLFELPVNRLSDIIETDQGFHIVRVIERQEEGYIPFEETQEKLRESILNARQEVATRNLLKEVKKEVPYEILVDGIEF